MLQKFLYSRTNFLAYNEKFSDSQKIFRLYPMLLLMGQLFLTACFALPIEEPPMPPPLVQIPEPRPIRTAVVTRGNVLNFSSRPTNHIPLRQQALHFTVANQRIRGVFASVGDEVYQGQILAELERPYIWTQLEDVRWEEELLLLQIYQLNERHDFALNRAEITGIPVDDSHYLEEEARLQSQLGIIRMRIDNLYQEAESMIIRAPFDGIVVFALDFAGVMWSSVGQVVITIAEQGDYIFHMLGDSANYVEIGDIIEKTVNLQPFTAQVVDPEAYGITPPAQTGIVQAEAFLKLIGEERPTITTAMFSFADIVYESAFDVLMLPNNIIEHVDERAFVYIMDGDILTTRDIEIGMAGNTMTEIRAGLAEGEMVVYGDVFTGNVVGSDNPAP